MKRLDSGSHDALLPAVKVSRQRILQASWGWGMLHFRMMELIDLFMSVSLILPGDTDGLRMAPHHFRCLITHT